MAIHTTIIDEYRTSGVVCLLEKQKYCDDFRPYILKVVRRFSNEAEARAAYEKAIRSRCRRVKESDE